MKVARTTAGRRVSQQSVCTAYVKCLSQQPSNYQGAASFALCFLGIHKLTCQPQICHVGRHIQGASRSFVWLRAGLESEAKQADPIGTQLIQLLPSSKSQCACTAFQSALVTGSTLLPVGTSETDMACDGKSPKIMQYVGLRKNWMANDPCYQPHKHSRCSQTR